MTRYYLSECPICYKKLSMFKNLCDWNVEQFFKDFSKASSYSFPGPSSMSTILAPSTLNDTVIAQRFLC